MACQIKIEPLTTVPLLLQPRAGTHEISRATGFLILHSDRHYLITNWHVATGVHPETDKPLDSVGRIPDSLVIWFHSAQQLGRWLSTQVPLGDRGSSGQRWIEHRQGQKVDVVALPVPTNEAFAYYPLDLSLAQTDLVVSPSDDVSIIGFPLGQAVNGNFPIWKTGHVASDIDLPYQGKPVFLVDATTKPAMSGSPVVAKRIGMVRRSTGFEHGTAERFLGVYSGHTKSKSDIGMVWKASVIHEILETSNDERRQASDT